MMQILSKLERLRKKAWKFLEKKRLILPICIFIIIIIFLLVIPSAIYSLESVQSESNEVHDTTIKTFWDGVWWTITTITTVGYGDIYPKTAKGKIIAVGVMLSGTVALEFLRASIISFLVQKQIQEALGMRSYKDKDHIIICEYNHRLNQIVKELRKNDDTKQTPIVLIADIERNPINEDNFYFIKGVTTDKNLQKANLKQAKTVIILGDHELSPENRDYKAILACLNVRKINSEVYTIVEIADETHLETFKGIADEIIVSSKLSSLLISNAVINHNISEVIFDILTYEYGSQILKIPVPKREVGYPFIHVFTNMKQNYQKTIIAIQKGEKGEIVTNPQPDYRLTSDDYLIVIYTDKKSSK